MRTFVEASSPRCLLLEPFEKLWDVLEHINQKTGIKIDFEKKEGSSYRSNLLGQRALDHEARYHPTRGTGDSHAPFRVSVLEFHDAFHAHVAAFRSLFFHEMKFFIAFGRQVNREGDN